MSTNDMDFDMSPSRKSSVSVTFRYSRDCSLAFYPRSRNHSTDTHRTRRSHRSHSRDRRDRRKERDRDSEDKRRRSRERDYRDRDRRSRSRERSHRDRDRRHRGDRREQGESRHRDRDEKERRRKRDEGEESPELKDQEERSKRKRHDEIDSPQSKTSDRRDRSRDRRYDDRRTRDARDEFDDLQRLRRGRERREAKPLPIDDTPLEDEEFDKRSLRRSPPVRYVSRFPHALHFTLSADRRSSPKYDPPVEDYNPDEPKEDDSEARSVFVSQLAARLTARDLGYFFEDKLGEGTVMDARIVTDRISRRSKG